MIGFHNRCGWGCGLPEVGCPEFFRQHHDGDAAVAGPSPGSIVRCEGTKLPAPHGAEAGGIHTGRLGKKADRSDRASGGERPVVGESLGSAPTDR